MNELDFIGALRAMAGGLAARALEDDAAVMTIGSETLVLTHDSLVSGVHVRADENPADIAWKLVAVNLSDLAAKGAQPVGVLLTHMLGERDERFLTGLAEVLSTYDTPLLGGDTVRSPGTRSWACTAIGKATHTPVPDRRSAQMGHAVYVTGTLGRAMLGFEGDPAHDLAYRRPVPLLAEGRALAPMVSAMMDVSDGLLLDARRMAEASGTSFALDSAAFPVADPSRILDCATWGDDYQLLFTAPPEAALPVAATRIGCVRERESAPLLLDDAAPPRDRLGYQH